MPQFDSVETGYHNLWEEMDYAHPGMSRDTVIAAIDVIIAKGLQGRSQYEAVEKAIGVPWYWVLGVHYRESNFNFKTHLHNGDSLDGYTFHVPAGRPQVGHGPPFQWFESAIDALTMRGLDKIKDWTVERDLYEDEGYNGWGYFGRLNTPYVWSWSSLYSGGKVLRDHGPIENVYDQQCGIAVILKRMQERGIINLSVAVVSALIEMGPLPDQANRPFKYSGTITLDGTDYEYATGGLNRGSAPYGTWQITPDAIGPIGQSLGAIGMGGGEIEDPKYAGAPRIGIEIHPGNTDVAANLISEGCLVLRQSKFPAFKKQLLADVAKEPQYITISPNGHAVIAPSPQPKEPPVTTTTTTPAPATPAAAAPALNIGSLFMTLAPTLLNIVPSILSVTPLAGLAPVAQVLANVVTKSQPTGGVTGTPTNDILKLVADEAYAIAVAIDPTLPHTT